MHPHLTTAWQPPLAKENPKSNLTAMLGLLVLCAIFVFSQIQLLQHAHAHDAGSDVSCVLCHTTDTPSTVSSTQLGHTAFAKQRSFEAALSTAAPPSRVSSAYLARAPPIS